MKFDIRRIPTDELETERDQARKFLELRTRLGQFALAEFWAEVIDKIERELKRRRKVK